MELELSYAEMSFLRDVVRKEQYKIWQEQFADRLPKNISVEEAQKLFDKIMNKDIPDWLGVVCNRDCCNVLLKKFDELESLVQFVLKTK